MNSKLPVTYLNYYFEVRLNGLSVFQSLGRATPETVSHHMFAYSTANAKMQVHTCICQLVQCLETTMVVIPL